jgi:hypothetical protein
MQCQAITASTKAQCKRKGAQGSNFCTQHKSYTGALASNTVGNINALSGVSIVPNINITQPLIIEEVEDVKEPVEVKEGKNNTGLEQIYLDLDGYLDTNLFEDVDLVIDDPDNSSTLEDDELLESVVGKGGVLLLIPVGRDPITIDKTIYFDSSWTIITLDSILETIVAEYGGEVTNELKQLEKIATESDDEILEEYQELKDDKGDETILLYDLNLGLVRFTGIEEIRKGTYRVLLDYLE